MESDARGWFTGMPKSKVVKPKGPADSLVKSQLGYSEQDTADKLILPFLAKEHGFPLPETLDYQAQHSLALAGGATGRYDGIYLHGGYPYVVLEAKKYGHDLTPVDVLQARAYATSEEFDKPVPFLVISNGRDHQFYQRKASIDPADGHMAYAPVPPMSWKGIIAETPGEIRRILGDAELIKILLELKKQTFADISYLRLRM